MDNLLEFTIGTHEDFALATEVVGPYKTLSEALGDARKQLNLSDNDSFWVESRTIETEPDGADTIYTLEEHRCRPSGGELWLSIKEVLKYCSLSAETWRYWCRKGIIPKKMVKKKGRFWFVHAKVLNPYSGGYL